MATPYHALSSEEAIKELQSSAQGLTSEQAQQRLREFGKNELEKPKKESLFMKFIGQFNNFLIYILIIAVIIAALAGEYVDALVIGIVLILNAILGFVQEYKADRAIEALKKLASLKAFALRDRKRVEVDATELVPGDIIFLDNGAKIPADSRLITCYSCYTLESALTGESTPVHKQTDPVSEDKGLGDRKSMAYAGTTLNMGHGTAIVTTTGMRTELGKIAGMIFEAEPEPSPLQRYLEHFGKRLGIAVILICIATFFAGITHGFGWLEMLIASISLAVAAVPEGLPAIVTITLALGVQRMVKRNVLVRRLPSVETLGSCTVICSDKTGTLTHDQMTVKEVYVDGKSIHVHGSGYSTKGRFDGTSKHLQTLLRAGALCTTASLEPEGDTFKVVGDPTEGALLISAIKGGLDLKKEAEAYQKTDEIPFSSERRMMSTAHTQGKMKYVFTKGAPDRVLACCSFIAQGEHVRKITPADKKKIMAQTEDYAKNALRVLGFAYSDKPAKNVESGLIFLGLQAMIDPPRAEAIEAVKVCKEAGIKVVMITGDHKLTAQAIAERMGITGRAIDGAELATIKDLASVVENIGVYARVEPVHKVRIVEAFKARGHIVAMTGDGVNDAPALKKADIGVAMGKTGTDVTKEAADMVLLDDNFASLVAAVREGRTIFDNIQKFVEYLLSCNLAEVGVIFFGIMFGMPLPLIAIQILWMNLVTDGLPALALGVDPPEPSVMTRKPVKKGQLLDSVTERRILFTAFLVTLGTLGLFILEEPGVNTVVARSMAFSTIVFLELAQALSCRSSRQSFLSLANNKWLWAALSSSALLQLVIYYTPLSTIFEVVPPTLEQWGAIFGIVLFFFVLREGMKHNPKDRVKS